jgi:hypothetical protein
MGDMLAQESAAWDRAGASISVMSFLIKVTEGAPRISSEANVVTVC